jgi:ABC-type phosphate transport system auxiliary subunit
MEHLINLAWGQLSVAYGTVVRAKDAQEEDDKAGEELDRTKQKFVQRMEKMITQIGEIQEEMAKMIEEHNNV